MIEFHGNDAHFTQQFSREPQSRDLQDFRRVCGDVQRFGDVEGERDRAHDTPATLGAASRVLTISAAGAFSSSAVGTDAGPSRGVQNGRWWELISPLSPAQLSVTAPWPPA